MKNFHSTLLGSVTGPTINMTKDREKQEKHKFNNICMGAPKRYEAQKTARQLRFLSHLMLRKSAEIWGYQGEEGHS